MMTEPSMVSILAKIPNRYMIVNVAARRARDIAEEADVNGEDLPAKPVTLALEDIADGKLRITDRKPVEEKAPVKPARETEIVRDRDDDEDEDENDIKLDTEKTAE